METTADPRHPLCTKYRHAHGRCTFALPRCKDVPSLAGVSEQGTPPCQCLALHKGESVIYSGGAVATSVSRAPLYSSVSQPN